MSHVGWRLNVASKAKTRRPPVVVLGVIARAFATKAAISADEFGAASRAPSIDAMPDAGFVGSRVIQARSVCGLYVAGLIDLRNALRRYRAPGLFDRHRKASDE